MVKSLTSIKNKYFLKRELFLAITMIVIVFSFLPNFVSAAEMKISDEQVEKVKITLDIVNTASNFGSVFVDGGSFMKVLNTAIKGGQTATDVTYGLLVLSAINEMEFIDMVLSQEYKTLEREYFEQILKERTNLISYWKGVGLDLPRVLSGNITGPIGGLTLNTFEITSKVILIFTEFETLKKGRQYDGLWYYFDFRRSGDYHEEAWELVEEQMGWAAVEGWSFSYKKSSDQKTSQLETQFLALWDKWAPYTTSSGVSEKYKAQVKSDLRQTLAVAIEDRPLYAEEPSLLDKFAVQLANISNAVAKLVSRVNPFKDSLVVPESVKPGLTDKKEVAEDGPPSISEIEPDESQEDLDDLLERADIESAENSSLPNGSEPVEIIEVEATTTEVVAEEPVTVPESEKIMDVGLPLIELCQRGAGGAARQYRVLINEVAWMGNQESADNEWIELKNVWGIPVNLAGWQLQDKDRQIKIVFEEGEAIPAGGYYLLERGKNYTGALNNIDEALYLFDNDCQLEDEVSAIPNWPAGDNYSKKTMQRFDVFSWYAGAVSAGAENSSPPAILAHPSAPAPAVSGPSYPKILITESQLSPINERFVELYNPNDAEVNLTGWYIQKKTATGDSFNSFITSTQFEGKTISSRGYFVIARALENADIILEDMTLTKNNTLVLKNPNRDIVDQVSTASPSGSQSYGRIWLVDEQRYLDEFEVQTPTPRSQNIGLEGGDGGDEPLAVVFNEIAWMGTKAAWQDEWIEIYANSGTNLDGWKILGISNDKTLIEINLFGFASSSTYILLERTDDSAVSDAQADFFFTGNLDNDGMVLELRDSGGNLIDSVDSWFAGDNDTKQTMERIDSLVGANSENWASNNGISRNGLDAEGNQINGTPKAENSVSKEFTDVLDDRIFSEDFTLTRFGSPYIWQGSIIVEVGAKLIVESGVEIQFKHTSLSQHAQLKVRGGLEAQDAVFTSYREDQPWDGIYFENSISTLDNVTVRYGGLLHIPPSGEFSPYTYGAIHIDGGSVSIKNSLIEKSHTFGLWLKNSTSSRIVNTEFRENRGSDYNGKTAALYIENSDPTITDSFFQDNIIGILAENYSAPVIKNNQFVQNDTPIQINSLLANLINNTFQDNGDNGVLVRAFGFSGEGQEISWKKINVPYFVDTALAIPSGFLLEIEPGVEIRLKNNGQINVDGVLQAKGTSQNKIIFTGASEIPGAWRYIKFSASSTDSILQDVIISFGGFFDLWGGERYGALKIEGLNLTIKDSVFENNRLAIELINAGFAGESKDIIIQNNEVGIYISAGSRPDLSDVIFGEGDAANTYDILP